MGPIVVTSIAAVDLQQVAVFQTALGVPAFDACIGHAPFSSPAVSCS
jgi:hypothetical protein